MIEVSEQPAWPTTLRSRLADGRLQGVNGALWMYRAVPLGPVVDARNPAESLTAAEPLLSFFEELAGQVNVGMRRRATSRGSYREVHVLLVNVPQRFAPGRGHALSEVLRQRYPNTAIDRRLLLVGVRLRDKLGGGGLLDAVNSVVETVVAGNVPLSDFDEDTERMNAAMDRSGLVKVSADDVRLANAWWNHGYYADTPMLVHPDHVHVFESVESVRMADEAGVDQCASWTHTTVPGTHAVTFASVQDLDLSFVKATDPTSHWVADLVGAGALAVSIRGVIEPGAITREELRRQRKRFIDDINERTKQGKMERAEQVEMMALLEGVEGLYATGGNPPPTLASASIVAGFDGQFRDVHQVLSADAPARLAMMDFRQHGAMAETWLCSHLRANPHLHDLPAQTVACSGIPSLSFVGDPDGALLGFTERDRQPAYLSPTAASTSDGLPIALCAGATGSGKTQVLLSLADQYARMGRPVVIVDPKMGSDHSSVVLAAGGQVASLDTLVTADGIFDPIRFSAKKEVGAELAASMLMAINPWGTAVADMEVPLTHALSYGVDKGATCIGQALAIAVRDQIPMPPEMVSRVEALASSSPMFRAIVGVNPSTEGLRTSSGITLIKVGDAYLDLPEPGALNQTLPQRVALAVVRMMVFGSAMALTGRQGVVMLDEAWVFLGAGRAEVERLGRLARSQGVLPMLFTQRVSDAVSAGLAGYISRGLVLSIEDEKEARAACELWKLDPTPARLQRIMAKATIGGNSAQAVSPNPMSMKALRDPVTGEVLRGSVCIYVDLSGRAVPVRVDLSPEFLAMSSTNPEDIKRREAAAAALAAAGQVNEDAQVLDRVF